MVYTISLFAPPFGNILTAVCLFSSVKHSSLKQINSILFTTRRLQTKLIPEVANMTERINVLLLGKTGHGKSLLGNILLGKRSEEAFVFQVGQHLNRETVEVASYEESVESVLLTVIDTPGFFDSETEVDGRWFDLLKAAELVGYNIDVFVLVISTSEIHSGARCIEQIQERFEEDMAHRLVFVFSHDEGNLSQEICDKHLATINSYCQRGYVGIPFLFSDQKAEMDVLDQKMKELLAAFQHIKKKKYLQVSKKLFVTNTFTVFNKNVSKLDFKISREYLDNNPGFDMALIKQFLTEKEIDSVIQKHNKNIRSCILS